MQVLIELSENKFRKIGLNLWQIVNNFKEGVEMIISEQMSVQYLFYHLRKTKKHSRSQNDAKVTKYR